MSRLIKIIGLLFLCLQISAQVNTSVGWSTDTINLGDEVDLLLFVKVAQGAQVEEISGGFLDSVISGFQTVRMRQSDSTRSEDFEYADIEIVDYGLFSIDDDDGVFRASELNWSKNQSGADILLSNKFRVRVWDPGQIVASNPRVSLVYNGEPLTSFQPFQAELFVRPPMALEEMEKDSFDIVPIKAIIEEPLTFKDFIPYLIGLGALFLCGAIYLLIKRVKARRDALPIEKVEIIIPAHQIALDKLHDLDSRKLWQSDVKGYQSELTYIIREYLEKRYSIPALETTTDEIVSAIRGRDIDAELIREMKNILQVADLVKFAKGKPSMSIHQEFMEKAFDFVRSTQEKNVITEE